MIESNLRQLKAKMQAAAIRSGREADAVTLVAISKRVSIDAIAAAYAAGQTVFGENYVQEAEQKLPALDAVISGSKPAFHLTGPLQTNKAKRAVAIFDCIQSVHSAKLAQALDAAAREKSKIQDVLIQVNVSAEDTKSGVSPAELPELTRFILTRTQLRLNGLMAIGSPLEPSPEGVELKRAECRELRNMLNMLNTQLGLKLSELSMGMSDDFEIAIEEGATMVRIGSALFGQRPELSN